MQQTQTIQVNLPENIIAYMDKTLASAAYHTHSEIIHFAFLYKQSIEGLEFKNKQEEIAHFAIAEANFLKNSKAS